MRIKNVNFAVSVMLLCFLFLAVGCPKQESSQEENQQQKAMPEEVEEIERSALEIMKLADLMPMIKNVAAQQQGEQAGNQQGNGENQQQNQQTMKEAITFEETILAEILKREQERQAGGEQENKEEAQDIPKNKEEAWDRIKMTLVELHDQWNALEPLLIDENVSPEEINGFEGALDNLTSAGTNKDYYGTLTAANRITRYLPQFMEPFANNSSPQASELKYFLRSLVVNAAVNDYDLAWENLNHLKERERMITKDLEEQDAQATADEYNASIEDLERALAKEDIDLIKINAAVVMDNIMQVNEDLAKA